MELTERKWCVNSLSLVWVWMLHRSENRLFTDLKHKHLIWYPAAETMNGETMMMHKCIHFIQWIVYTRNTLLDCGISTHVRLYVRTYNNAQHSKRDCDAPRHTQLRVLWTLGYLRTRVSVLFVLATHQHSHHLPTATLVDHMAAHFKTHSVRWRSWSLNLWPKHDWGGKRTSRLD